MEVLNLILITVALVLIAVGAMSVRLLFVKDGKFSGGSCRSTPELNKRGVTCGCGNEKTCAANDPEKN